VVEEAFSMIEPIMFVGIGFLVAGLLVIAVIPLVHARAERLTTRRLEALTPLSMAEIQADKDQLRAEFAMSTRRLEMSVEQLKAKTTSQLTEIGKKSDAIGRLKLELGEKTAALFALEAKENQLTDELRSFRDDLTSKGAALAEMERALASTRAELAQARDNSSESSVTANSQRVELVALRAQAEALKGQIESYEMETQELQDRLRNKTAEVASLSNELAEERGRAEQLGTHVGQLDRQLIAQMTESEVLGRRVEELTARLDEQGRFLADREFVSGRLRNEAAGAQKIGSEVRAALAEAENRHRVATEAIRAEKASIAAQLEQSQDERVKLQREIAAMKHDAENSGANERVENALLRERINDIAAEVARLTATLEGPASPIASILNSDAGHSDGAPNGSNGASLSIAPRIGESKGTLADRIRALQSRASQIPRRAAPRA
jgi:chromosome segregation ATPase